jgi:hypothetical protein
MGVRGGGGKTRTAAQPRPDRKKPAPDSSRWSQGNEKLKQLATTNRTPSRARSIAPTWSATS